MVRDALDAVDRIVNFADSDEDNDGYIDAISIVHSGYGAEYGAGRENWIWSHQWSLWQLPGGQWTSSDSNSNGESVKVYAYHTEPALRDTSGTRISSLGVAVHETMHFLGLPDLYDVDYSGSGVGAYCAMASSWGFDGTGDYPGFLSAWSKMTLGWISPTVLSDPGNYSLQQAETQPESYMIQRNFPPGEYLLVENRQPVSFDSKMPQGGLLIWHIDEMKSNNSEEGYPSQSGWPQNGNHYRVALLQADGQYDLEKSNNNRGDSGDAYHGDGIDQISSATVPSTISYQIGHVGSTGNMISMISRAAPQMGFAFSHEGGACQDLSSNCARRQRRGQCETRPDEMRRDCEKTCGFC